MDEIEQQAGQGNKSKNHSTFLIGMLFRYKWLILLVPVVVAVASALFAMSGETLYSFSTVLVPGRYLDSVTNIEKRLVTPEELAEQINNEDFHQYIVDDLEINPGFLYSLNAKVRQRSNTVRVTWTGVDNSPGIQILESLIDAISAQHSQTIEIQRKLLENEIKNAEMKIENDEQEVVAYKEVKGENEKLLNSTMKGFEDKIELYKKKANEEELRIKEMVAAKLSIDSNTTKIMNERLALLSSESADKGDDLSLLLFLNLLQSNLALAISTSSELYTARQELQNHMIMIENIRKDMDDYRTNYNKVLMENNTEIFNREKTINQFKSDIEKMNLQLQILSDLEVLQRPQKSLSPLPSKMIVSTVAAFFIALFFTLIVIMLLERFKDLDMSAFK